VANQPNRSNAVSGQKFMNIFALLGDPETLVACSPVTGHISERSHFVRRAASSAESI
jgi:hypothetical protein